MATYNGNDLGQSVSYGSHETVHVVSETLHVLKFYRNAKWKGLSQWVNITAGLRYSLSGFIKLLNVEAGSLYHNVETVMYCGNDQGQSVSSLLHTF